METLHKRLGVVQDELMNLFEKDSDQLSDQIAHWTCIKQENVLLNFARRNGIIRLGYQTVPSLVVTEQLAKKAIELLVVLGTLNSSAYAEESWTLTDTSRERWEMPPGQCLKKGPIPIEIKYDGDKDTGMIYTGWHHIYFQNCDDKWEKVPGQVDHTGAFYMDGKQKCYYLEFKKDAERFSKTKTWEVHYKHEVFSPITPVTSSTPEDTLPETKALRPISGSTNTSTYVQRPNGGQPNDTTAVDSDTATGGPTSTTPDCSGRKRRQQRESGPRHQTKCRRRLSECPTDSDEASTGSDTDPEFQPRAITDRLGRAESKNRGCGPTRQGGGRGGGRGRGRGRGRGGRGGEGGSCRGAEQENRETERDFGEISTTVGTWCGSTNSASDHPISRTAQVPILLISGGANQLKCLRFRWTRKPGLVDNISTTWKWATQGDAFGARMLLTFHSENQRANFLTSIPLPAGVTASFGALNEI
ncbi:E2 [Trichechus manatus papillomavirus]|nr:E2 [Trichechus manatus papillomavirus]